MPQPWCPPDPVFSVTLPYGAGKRRTCEIYSPTLCFVYSGVSEHCTDTVIYVIFTRSVLLSLLFVHFWEVSGPTALHRIYRQPSFSPSPTKSPPYLLPSTAKKLLNAAMQTPKSGWSHKQIHSLDAYHLAFIFYLIRLAGLS